MSTYKALAKALVMNNCIKTTALISLLFVMSGSLSAANFFSDLSAQQVQQIFDQADQTKSHSFVHNASSKVIPVVQILPQVTQAQSTLKAGTSCIKLYNCSQGICLLALNGRKYAASEIIVKNLTVLNQDTQQCIATSSPTKAEQTAKADQPVKAASANTKAAIFSWVKVINVESNDALNIRQQANYKTKKMGSAAYNASCIKRFRCKGKWCEIQSQNVTGWVHRKYLQKLSTGEAASCS